MRKITYTSVAATLALLGVVYLLADKIGNTCEGTRQFDGSCMIIR